MFSFLDRAGYSWDLSLSSAAVARVSADAALGLPLADLLRDVADRPSAVVDVALVADAERFGRLLWLLCVPQAAADRVGADEFFARLDGPSIIAARLCLAQALIEVTNNATVGNALVGCLKHYAE